MTEKQRIFKYIKDENCDIIDIKLLDESSSKFTLKHGGVKFDIETKINFDSFKSQLDFNTNAIFILQNQEEFDLFISRIPIFENELNEYCMIHVQVVSPVIKNENKTEIIGNYTQVLLKKDWENKSWKIQ